MSFVLGAFFQTAADIILGISTGVGSNFLADKFRENSKDAQPLEYQMFLCMEDALEACCSKLDLVYEGTGALPSSFFVGVSRQAQPFSESTLGDILADSLGEQVNSFDRSYLVKLYLHLLFNQLAQPKYEELHKYLVAQKILPDSPVEQKRTIKRTLTPHINTVSEGEVLGRDEFVEGLKEQLEARLDGKPCRLHLWGMGGIGKTDILRALFTHYCDKGYEGSVESVVFINYSGNANGAILEIADRAEEEHDPIWERLKATTDSRLDQAWRYLRALAESYSMLLLVDDVTLRETGQAPDFAQEDSFTRLLELNTPLVLASRYRDSLLKERFKNERIPPLPLPVLQDIYVKALNDDDSDGNRDIPVEDEPALHELFEERAGLNTLVIQRLGAIAGTQGFGVFELCSQLDKLHFVIKSGDGDDDDTLQEEVSKLYDIDSLLNPQERNIVKAFSLFPALTLDVGTCVEWLQQDTGLGQRKLREALSKLARGTWLQKTSSTTGTAHFSMHQLVAVAVSEQPEPQGAGIILEHTGLIEACRKRLSWEEARDFRDASPYIAIAQSIAARLTSEPPTADECSKEQKTSWTRAANLCGWLGKYHNDAGAPQTALELCLKALAINEKVLGVEHASTAASYNNIGSAYHALGDYDKALELCLKALAINEKALGVEHASTARGYNNIGGVYRALGDYDKALEFFSKALAVYEKVLGVERTSTATSYNNIGGVYDALGDYDKALGFYSKAQAIFEKVLGVENPSTAASYNNIGEVYRELGDCDKALEFHSKALAINEKVLGVEHASTAASYNNIGLVYAALGDYDKALEFHSKALAINEKVLGVEHSSTAMSYNNIGEVYRALGEHDKALEFHSKALAIDEKVLGVEHASTAASYNNIGLVYDALGDYDKALEFHSKALAIDEKVLGVEHPSTTRDYNNIGGVYHALGDYDKALEFYSKAQAMYKKVLGDEHTSTATIYNNIGEVYRALENYDRAREYLLKALRVICRVLGSEHQYTQSTMRSLHEIYRKVSPDTSFEDWAGLQ